MTPRVRVTVERAFSPRCGLAVGDYFEVAGAAVTLPQGKPFCVYAMAATFGVLDARMSDLPPDHWLARKPFICCPDADDGVVMRLERIDEDDRATGGAA
ncbi:MAG: TIGR04076 family protein [Gaiellales bacterium]